MGKKLSEVDKQARRDKREEFPKPLPVLELGKRYEFRELNSNGSYKRQGGDGEEVEKIKGTVIDIKNSYYIIKTKNYITSIHKNSIGTSVEAVLIK